MSSHVFTYCYCFGSVIGFCLKGHNIVCSFFLGGGRGVGKVDCKAVSFFLKIGLVKCKSRLVPSRYLIVFWDDTPRAPQPNPQSSLIPKNN